LTQIQVASAIEALFMISTFVLLVRAAGKPVFHWIGTILLCMTFCWSVILGCIIALRDITIPL